MRCVSKLWLSARFKVVCHSSGMTRLVSTYCRLCTRILLFNRVEHKNKYDHEVTRKTLPSLCPRLLKKAAALDKREAWFSPTRTVRKSHRHSRSAWAATKLWEWQRVWLQSFFQTFEDDTLSLFHGGLFVGNWGKSCESRFSPCQDVGHEFQIWGFLECRDLIRFPTRNSKFSQNTGSHPPIHKHHTLSLTPSTEI